MTRMSDNDALTGDPMEMAALAARTIADRSGIARHQIALVLGSGWGGAAAELGETVSVLPAAEVPGFSAPAVVGHGGTISSIAVGDRHALVLGARTHFYEDKGVRAVAHAVRTAAACGATVVVLTLSLIHI